MIIVIHVQKNTLIALLALFMYQHFALFLTIINIIKLKTYLNATVTRVTGEPLSKAATKVWVGRMFFEIFGSPLIEGAAWA